MGPILILTAVELEARRLARDLELPLLRRRPFPIFGRGAVRISHVGLGAAYCAARWPALLADLDRPLVVSAGVCGALDPRLMPGTLVVPDRVIDHAGRVHAVDARAHAAAAGRVGHAWSVAALVTVRAIVATPADKAALHARTGAAAVDMESAAIVESAAAAGLPALVIRGVCDGAAEPLPARLTRLVTPDGRLRLARAMVLTVARPGTVPQALGLRRQTHRALGAVSRALAALIR